MIHVYVFVLFMNMFVVVFHFLSSCFPIPIDLEDCCHVRAADGPVHWCGGKITSEYCSLMRNILLPSWNIISSRLAKHLMAFKRLRGKKTCWFDSIVVRPRITYGI